MYRSGRHSARLLLLLASIGAGAEFAPAAAQVAVPAPAATLPATAPTGSVSDLPSARPATLPRRAEGNAAIQWDGAVLAIRASGEDLPTILTEVSRVTGLKVTGGVPDERVFGNYGPGSVQQVVADLLDGLYVNLVLLDGTATAPKELILTPRTGGPTPPSPARAVVYEPPIVRADRPFRSTPAPGLSEPPSQQPAGSPIVGSQGADPNAAAAPGGSSAQPQSPNGVRTPEQIFEELRKRQQQAQQGLSGR